MKLFSMYNQTVQWDFFSLLRKLCLSGPRCRNVRRLLVSDGVAVPSGGHMTQRGRFPCIEQGVKELKKTNQNSNNNRRKPLTLCQSLASVDQFNHTGKSFQGFYW